MLESIKSVVSINPWAISLISGFSASICTVLGKEVIQNSTKFWFESIKAKRKRREKNKRKLFKKVYEPIMNVRKGIYNRDGDCSSLLVEDVGQIFKILDDNDRYLTRKLVNFHGEFMGWLEQSWETGDNADYPKKNTDEFWHYVNNEYEKLRVELYGTGR